MEIHRKGIDISKVHHIKHRGFSVIYKFCFSININNTYVDFYKYN